MANETSSTSILHDFKLLVDRATEILGNLSSNQRIEAINYAIKCIKEKFPESCEHIKRDYINCENNDQNQSSQKLLKYENLWNNNNDKIIKQEERDDIVQRTKLRLDNRQPGTSSTISKKFDLNQNFEKIICKEEFMCIDDGENDTKHFNNNNNNSNNDKKLLSISIFNSQKNLDKNLYIASNATKKYYNNNDIHIQEAIRRSPTILLSRIQTPSTSSSILASSRLASTSTALINLDKSQQYNNNNNNNNDLQTINININNNLNNISNNLSSEKFIINSSTKKFYLNYNNDHKNKYKFITNEFCIKFMRSEENFNLNAFKKQILNILEFAMIHRKPFLRNFFNKLVLSGAISCVRPFNNLNNNNNNNLIINNNNQINNNNDDDKQLIRISEIKTNNLNLLNDNDDVNYCKNGLINNNNNNFNNIINNDNNKFLNNSIVIAAANTDDTTCTTEEASQNTDTSSDDANIINNNTNMLTITNPSNSIAIVTNKTPKDKKNNARIVKDKQTYDCLLCPKTYRKRKSLIDHYKMHPGYCHDCGQPNGLTLEEIIDHNRVQHAQEFPFICEICGESYSRRQQFHTHVEAHNKKDIQSYSCGECGMEFPRKKLHRQHLDETGHKPDGAICEVCGAAFTSKNALCQHMNRVHKKDNSFECHICQNRFSLKANLERHVQLHTEIKRTFVCDQCGSSYFTFTALRDHFSNAHTDASESKCTLCGKTFSSVKSLQRHLPSHSEERPHSCCYCMQNFKWKTHLVRHKQIVHGNQPVPKKLKRFAKCEEELVPVDIAPPPPAKIARKNNKPKSSPSSKASSSSSVVTSPTTPTQTSTTINNPVNNNNTSAQQLESQNQFSFPTNDNLIVQRNPNTENNLLMNINNFNPGAENYHFDPRTAYNNSPRIGQIQAEQQLLKYETPYQQNESHQPSQSPSQAIVTSHLHQQQQQQQQQHHHQQQLHQHHQQQQSLQAHQQAHQVHQQQTLQGHQQQPLQQHPHHQQPHQVHQQQPHQQARQPIQHPQPHPVHHQALQGHPQYNCASISNNDWHQMNFNPANPGINPNMETKDNKYFSVIEVNSNDFMGLPMDTTPKQESVLNPELISFQNMWSPNNQQINFNNGTGVEQHSYNNIGSILTNLELIGNNASMDFNNFDMMGSSSGGGGVGNGNGVNNPVTGVGPSSDPHHNIGTQQSPQQMQQQHTQHPHVQQHPHTSHPSHSHHHHNPYLHPDIDPNSGNLTHSVMNYDYQNPNHTITDISNTIKREQDQKSQQQQQQQQQYQQYPSQPQTPTYDHHYPNAGVYQNQNDDIKPTILPPLTDYMHPPMQQQQQQQQQGGAPNDVIAYYPVKNEM